jgi:hypothetical protein
MMVFGVMIQFVFLVMVRGVKINDGKIQENLQDTVWRGQKLPPIS